jgi:hypothetical protein
LILAGACDQNDVCDTLGYCVPSPVHPSNYTCRAASNFLSTISSCSPFSIFPTFLSSSLSPPLLSLSPLLKRTKYRWDVRCTRILHESSTEFLSPLPLLSSPLPSPSLLSSPSPSLPLPSHKTNRWDVRCARILQWDQYRLSRRPLKKFLGCLSPSERIV